MNLPPPNNIEQKPKDSTIPDYVQAGAREYFAEKIDLNSFSQNDNGTVTPPLTLDDFEAIRITAEKDIPQHQPTIKVGEKGIAARGNITGISAQIKAGKTALCSVILAGAISANGAIDGFSGLWVEPNPEGKAVINGDTEQSADDQQYNVITILKRAGLDCTPDYFLSYNLRQLNRSDYQNTLDAICADASRRFNGIHLITIDGGADFCQSVNDDKEAGAIVEYFTHLAIQYDCPVIIVIHQNPNSDKERGHLGSEIQRKCYGLISIAKTGDVSTAAVKVGRKAGVTDTPMIHYRYDAAKGYHVQTEEPDAENDRAEADMERHRQLALQIFSGQKSYNYTDAYMAIMQATGRKERTAKTMVSNMAGWGFIERGNDKNYRISARCNLVQKGAKIAPV